MELILIIGVSNSGKSTYIDKHLMEYQLISCDDILETIGGEFFTTWANYHTKEKYTNISAVRAVEITMCEALMKRKRSIVIDDLNIKEDKVTFWLDLADKYNYSKTAIILNDSIENKSLLNRFDKIEIEG